MHSVAKVGDPFLLGVNYWPRQKAMYWWRDFDAGEVRDEFAMIRGIGLTHVRFFLLWESFQPRVDHIDSVAIGNLRTVCDIAQEVGLRLQPTFFTGHMSGPNWAPNWLLSHVRRQPSNRQIVSLSDPRGSDRAIYNLYTEPFVIEAEDRLLRAVCGELKDHPAIWAWSLGNEPDLFCRPPSAFAGRQWIADRAATIKSVDRVHPVLIGLHLASLDEDVGLRVDHIAQVTDISVMHGYSIYHSLARTPLDPDFVPFTCALTTALAQRPVLYEEFGVNTGWPDGPSRWEHVRQWDGSTRKIYFASEEDAAKYYAAVLPRLARVGALGAFCWCFGDYDSCVWDRPPCDWQPHERFFGLVRADGSIKPMGRAVADFAMSEPRIKAAENLVQLDGNVDEFYYECGDQSRELYRRFCNSSDLDL